MRRGDFNLSPAWCGVVLFLAGLAVALVVDATRPAAAGKVWCIAHYGRLSPFEFVGFDNCGTTWKLVLPRPPGAAPTPDSMGRVAADSAECWYLDRADGAYRQVPCPAPGDTVGWVETGED